MTGLFGHSDRPLQQLSQDSLGLAPYAESLADFVLQCETPMTVAIQGDWGSGKTSMMRMVEDAMRVRAESRSLETVWFNTWQYSQFATNASLTGSLLTSLMRELKGKPTVVERSVRILQRLSKPAAGVVGRALTAGAVDVDKFDLSDEALDSAVAVRELKEAIGETIREKLESGTSRIVIFIDDLDRIIPARAVEVLEVLKLFLDWEGCVFILALDHAVVRRGLLARFGVSEADLSGRSFFDKLIQLPFSIPTARLDMESYVKGLFAIMGLEMAGSDPDLFTRLIRFSVSTNPRGIKRVFNSLQLLLILSKRKDGTSADVSKGEEQATIRILFSLLCLQISYEGVYEWLTGRGQEIGEADLLSLGSMTETARQDPDFAFALAKLTDIQRADFARFGQAFVEAVQDAGEAPEASDAEKLASLRRTLALSRVTAVRSPVTEPEPAQDREFRWKNRAMMEEVKQLLEAQMAADTLPALGSFKLYQPHSQPLVTLRRPVDEEGNLDLGIGSSVDAFELWVGGSPQVIKLAQPALEALLQPLASPKLVHSRTGPVFYRKEVGERIDTDQRRRILFDEVLPAYVSAYRALQGGLGPENAS